MKRTLFLFALVAWTGLLAQTIKCGSLEGDAHEHLKRDMEFLASDDLEGRLPGTEGANMAVSYIIRNFHENFG
jgi:hypothetical protein